jgi:glycosyltransferase involved in cell wall biosynthesis
VKVIFATPTIKRPFAPYLAALEASVPLLDAAGIEHQIVFEVGCPYISGARATMTRKALDARADVIVYLDHDVSWDPENLLTLINTEGDVVAGTYRIKHEPEEYMSVLYCGQDGRPIVRESDGAVKARLVPAGFLKITKEGINRFMYAFPELTYGPLFSQSVDLFNHGAVLGDRIWWGEDYCFAQRWNDKCGDLWLVPNLNITHHNSDGVAFPGNFHQYLLRQPGGSESENPNAFWRAAATRAA